MTTVRASYVLVASRVSASLYRSHGPGVAPELVRSFDHPEGRLKAGQIDSDRPGRSFDRTGGGRHALSSEESPVERIAHEFALQLAHELERARQSGEFDALALIAPPRMLGLLRDALSKSVRELVYGELDKDLDQSDLVTLRKHLDQLAKP